MIGDRLCLRKVFLRALLRFDTLADDLTSPSSVTQGKAMGLQTVSEVCFLEIMLAFVHCLQGTLLCKSA